MLYHMYVGLLQYPEIIESIREVSYFLLQMFTQVRLCFFKTHRANQWFIQQLYWTEPRFSFLEGLHNLMKSDDNPKSRSPQTPSERFHISHFTYKAWFNIWYTFHSLLKDVPRCDRLPGTILSRWHFINKSNIVWLGLGSRGRNLNVLSMRTIAYVMSS